MDIVILYHDKWVINMDDKIKEISELVDDIDMMMFDARDISKTIYYSMQYCFENELSTYNLLIVCEILNKKLEEISEKVETLDLNVFNLKSNEIFAD
jgi:hypothetical protein